VTNLRKANAEKVPAKEGKNETKQERSEGGSHLHHLEGRHAGAEQGLSGGARRGPHDGCGDNAQVAFAGTRDHDVASF
jgi:hypothetical protein